MKSLIRSLLLLLLLLRATQGEAAQTLTSNDVANVLAQALTRANYFLTNGTTTNAVVAVVNREGFVLGVLSLQAPGIGPIDSLTTNLAVVNAISKAGTAAFLSSDQNAFTSRTAGYIVQQHFPPLIANVAPGPLVGVNFSSMAFSDVNRYKNPANFDPSAYGGGGTNGLPITTIPALEPLSGLNGSPGGVPLYKEGQLVGGVGAAIKGKGMIPELADIQLTTGETYDPDEDVALAGQKGYQPSPSIFASQVFIGGIRLPYVNSTTRLTKVEPIGFSAGVIVTNYPVTDSPPVLYPAATLGGAKGEIRAPIIDDPEGRLTTTDISNIFSLAARNAADTRAGIRQPTGTSAKIFIAVVNNPADPNVAPMVLGTFRILDATVFSWDVAVQKARTALFFSTSNSAYSVRAVGFLAQSLYPPGINGTSPGPLFGLQEVFSLLQMGVTNPLNGIYLEPNKIPRAPFTSVDTITNFPLQAPQPRLPDGITIFPGGFPLYKNGALVGAVGVSGDGVDVDDLIAAWGTVGFEAPIPIRCDQIIYRGTRLPYAKFPRNPTL